MGHLLEEEDLSSCSVPWWREVCDCSRSIFLTHAEPHWHERTLLVVVLISSDSRLIIPQLSVLQHTSFLSNTKLLCKTSLCSVVKHTYGSHGAQSFSDSFYFIMPIVPKIHFYLTNDVSSQLGKYGCHSRYPGWSQWPFGSEWPAVTLLLVARQQVLPWKEEARLNTLVS